MTNLTAVNLFAGIEGFGLALHRAGIRTVAAVEIEPTARGVIADHFPDTTLFNDVREVTADDIRATGFVPDRGVLTGGWPCQDLSLAGRRLGLGGARSGLVWEVIRLLDGLRPRWFILENVPGLLSAVCSCPGLDVCGLGCDDPHPVPSGHCGFAPGGGHCDTHDGPEHPCPSGKERVCERPCVEPHDVPGGACGYVRGSGRCMELHGGAMGAVLGALAGLGYGIGYRVLDAQHFGVPQRRRRVVLVGCLGDRAAPVEVLLEPESRRGHPASRRAPGQRTAVVSAISASGGGPDDNDATDGRLIVGTVSAKWAKGTGGPSGDEVQNLVPVAFDLAQITSAENRVNPQQGDPSMPLAATGSPHVAFTLSSRHHGVGQAHNTTYVPFGGERVVHPLTAEGADASEDGTGRGTPLVALSLAVAGDFSAGIDVAQAVRAAHGQPGLVATVVDDRGDSAGSISPALKVGHDGSGPHHSAVVTAFDWKTDGSDRARPNISTERTSALGTTKQDAVAYNAPAAMAVRRLTPTECERLQGFPDGWTATSNGVPQSDSERYRRLGNSIAVPVFEWVAKRLVEVDRRSA